MKVRSIRRRQQGLQGKRAREEAMFVAHMRESGFGPALEAIGIAGVKAALHMAHILHSVQQLRATLAMPRNQG